MGTRVISLPTNTTFQEPAMNRFIHITKAETIAIQITRYTGRGRQTHSYRPGAISQARLTAAIQHAPAVIEIKNDNLYIAVSK